MQLRGHVHSHKLAAQVPRYNYKFFSLSVLSVSVSFTLEEYKSTEIVDCLYPSLFSNVYPLNARSKINTWVNREQKQYNTKSTWILKSNQYIAFIQTTGSSQSGAPTLTSGFLQCRVSRLNHSLVVTYLPVSVEKIESEGEKRWRG